MKQLVVKPEKCIGCRTCELVCSFGHYEQFSPRLANITVLEYEAATCMKVCPVKAITRDENGACVINYDKCIGCKMCKSACPLGNMSYSTRLRRVFKCDLCGGDPKCVRFCPGGALLFADPDEMDHRNNLTPDKIVAAMGTEG